MKRNRGPQRRSSANSSSLLCNLLLRSSPLSPPQRYPPQATEGTGASTARGPGRSRPRGLTQRTPTASSSSPTDITNTRVINVPVPALWWRGCQCLEHTRPQREPHLRCSPAVHCAQTWLSPEFPDCFPGARAAVAGAPATVLLSAGH